MEAPRGVEGEDHGLRRLAPADHAPHRVVPDALVQDRGPSGVLRKLRHALGVGEAEAPRDQEPI